MAACAFACRHGHAGGSYGLGALLGGQFATELTGANSARVASSSGICSQYFLPIALGQRRVFTAHHGRRQPTLALLPDDVASFGGLLWILSQSTGTGIN